MNKFWEDQFVSESDDGTWEFVNDDDHKTVRLLFYDYKNQGTPDEELLNGVQELKLSRDQFISLLKFAAKLNSKNTL